MLNKELKQPTVFLINSVLLCKPSNLCFAERRVIATTAFRNIVEECGDIQDPWPVEFRHQAAAERKLVGMLIHGESSKIPYHLQDVLIDCVDMKEIVLHLAHDFSKDGQNTTKNA